jgi:hypothetical protein
VVIGAARRTILAQPRGGERMAKGKSMRKEKKKPKKASK